MPKLVTCFDSAPDAAPGIYSQAIRAGPFVYTSGFVGVDDTGTVVTGSVRDRTLQALQNVRVALLTANMNMEHVIKATVYLTGFNDSFELMNEAWKQVFPSSQVVRTCVGVAELVYGTDVEIEVVAYDG